MGLCFWKFGILPHEFEKCSQREKHMMLGFASYYQELEEKAIKKASK